MGVKKLTVTQGGTQTRDLANGLPYSNQLSYRVTRQLSGRIRVLKAELPGIQLRRISSWHVGWGGFSVYCGCKKYLTQCRLIILFGREWLGGCLKKHYLVFCVLGKLPGIAMYDLTCLYLERSLSAEVVYTAD